MARKPSTYWEKRSTELMKQLEKKTEYSINQLIEMYEKATKNINKEITKIFNNYAKDAGLKKETLVQLLNKRETETHYKNLLEVINNNITDESIKKKLLAKYNAPAYAYRISRYQQLQDNIDIELKKLADIENRITQKRYVDTIQDAYYHSIYEIQKGLGIGFSFSEVDMKTINLLLNEKWIDKGNFSTRIWNNSEKLSNYFKTQFTADTMAGISIQKMSRQLNDYMNVGLYNATRLVRTEVNHFANEGEMLSYEELGIEKYRFIATLDNITCEHCAELDNRVFNVKDRKPGKNYPPIHANDRCTTVAKFDDNVEDLQRRGRDENGNPILVPQDMNYQEWKEIYIDNSNLKNQGKSNIIGPSYLEEKLGKEHAQNIANIIKKSPENIKKVWNNYIDKININDINFKGTPHYSWTENGIYIDLEKISKDDYDIALGRNHPELFGKAYGVMFHEGGHHISAIYSRNKGINKDVSEWFESKKYFRKQLAKDGSIIQKGYTLDEMIKEEGWEYIDNTLKEMRNEAKRKGLKATSVNATQVYEKIKKELRSMSVTEQECISDIFDGITNGKIFGYSGHTFNNKNYWKKVSVGTEGFAEMTEALTQNKDSLKRIKQYFPKSYEIYEEIIKEMGGTL